MQGTLARSPEWTLWVGLLEDTARAIEDPRWSGQVNADRAVARAWLTHLGLGAVDVEAWSDAALRQDEGDLARLAEAAGVKVDRGLALAGLSVTPLLHALRRRATMTEHWAHGFCPVCGAWPVLAEYRGLERQRRLRCVRCGGDWAASWLSCVYCDERDHLRLGSIVPEARIETVKAEVCQTCRGYLKTVTTLGPLSFLELAMADLETVDLDLIAIERGFARPPAR